MTTPWLKTLDEIEGGHLPLVGGKAFNLATLRRHGLPVPDGLVVTTALFETHLRHHQFFPIWAGSPDVAVTEDALSWLADALKVSPLAPELTDALNTRLAEVFPDVETFAVRSSAIDEDSRQHTFSGIHLSELKVPREILPVSITRCWASALSKPALEYRRRHGIPIQSIRLAVLIQPFIQPAVAGVAFTSNPLTGAHDEIVIEATPGHGSAVARGQVMPDRYQLAKRLPDYPLLDWAQGDAPESSGAVRSQRDAPLGGDDHGSLSAFRLRKLAQFLERIEALMGGPQDVEWAITDKAPTVDEAIIFFQSRSIPVLTSNAAPPDVEWSRVDSREWWSDLPSPQCASLLHRAQVKVRSFFSRLGFDVHKLGPRLKIIYGRPYLNLTMTRSLLAQSGLSSDGILWIMGHTELPGTIDPRCAFDWRQLWRNRRPITRLMWRGLRPKAEVDRFARSADDVHRALSSTDWRQASPGSLLTLFRLRTDLSSQREESDFVLSEAAAATYSAIVQVLSPLANDVAQLVKEASRSARSASDRPQGHMLLELARIARADDRVRHYLTDTGANFVDYDQALAGTAFLAAFDDFLAQYGQSAAFEADPGWPRYGEDPGTLLATVARMTEVEALPDRREASVDEHPSGQMTAGDETKDNQLQESLRATRGLDSTLRYWLANLLVKRLRRLTEMRKQLRTQYGQSMSVCRTWDLRLAERWVAGGWLAEPEDFFWLTMEDVERALMGEAEVAPTIPALIRARREVYQTYAATEMPYAMRESDVTRLVPGHGLMETALSSVLSGLPVSPGQVQGRVAVLNRPEDSDRMQKGVILVTPSTDTAWFPLFLKARGLIIETGGLLSHGSIITREFGLPAVANIPNACSRFHDGDLVLLDGSTGLVQILNPVTYESP